MSWSSRVEKVFPPPPPLFVRRRCHVPSIQSIKRTDEQDQQRAQARVERRLDRDDLCDDKPRVPLELAPPHGVAEAKEEKRGRTEKRQRAIESDCFVFCLKSFVSF